MRQKKLFDGTLVPAIWQGSGGIISNDNTNSQVRIWIEGIRFGCSAIDTSERYGNGFSERLIGKVLLNVNRSNVFIATKVAPENLGRLELIRACERSLKRMNIPYIDLYQIHWNNPLIDLEETLQTMLQLRREGKIKYVGVCNFTLSQIEQCNELLDGELASVQMEYNLSNRLCERDIVPYCEEMGILFLGYSPFNSGKQSYSNDVLKSIALKHRRTINQVILNWITSRFNICALSKTSSMKHVIENAQSTEFELDEEDIQSISNSFKQTIVRLKPSTISCENSLSGIEGNVPAYKTVDEAIQNKYNQMPAPLELADEVARTRTLSKPIFVRKHGRGYELVGGNVRYWAWVIAFGMDEQIECIII